MTRWNPCKRKDFIHGLRKLGFEGPLSGARHQFMIHGKHRLAIPSNAEYSIPQLGMMLAEVGIILDRDITADEWTSL